MFGKKPILCEWTDGWTDGDQKWSSVFLIFKYISKQDVLIPNMVSKVVYHFFLTLKIWDEVGDGHDQFSKSPYEREF